MHTCRDDGSHLLYDHCDRCAEHADHPFEDLDGRHLLAIYDIGIEVGERGVTPRIYTDNELRAARNIMTVMRHAGRIEKLRMNRAAAEAGRM